MSVIKGLIKVRASAISYQIALEDLFGFRRNLSVFAQTVGSI